MSKKRENTTPSMTNNVSIVVLSRNRLLKMNPLVSSNGFFVKRSGHRIVEYQKEFYRRLNLQYVFNFIRILYLFISDIKVKIFRVCINIELEIETDRYQFT